MITFDLLREAGECDVRGLQRLARYLGVPAADSTDVEGLAERIDEKRRADTELFQEPKPSAVFSLCGKFRWILRWPTGRQNDRIMAVIAANPSKAGQLRADGTMRSDPTVSRMRNLAGQLGFGWLWMLNARSFVATDPTDVPPDPYAVGEETDAWIERAARAAELVVVAYGHLAGERARRVLEIVRSAGKVPHALAVAKDGTPRHPRGLPASARPFPLPEDYLG